MPRLLNSDCRNDANLPGVRALSGMRNQTDEGGSFVRDMPSAVLPMLRPL